MRLCTSTPYCRRFLLLIEGAYQRSQWCACASSARGTCRICRCIRTHPETRSSFERSDPLTRIELAQNEHGECALSKPARRMPHLSLFARLPRNTLLRFENSTIISLDAVDVVNLSCSLPPQLSSNIVVGTSLGYLFFYGDSEFEVRI